jgi:hypothetical protein
MVLDRSGPTLLVRILIGVPIRPPETWTPEAVEAWTHFEVNLRFNDIDSLELSEFNQQKRYQLPRAVLDHRGEAFYLGN